MQVEVSGHAFTFPPKCACCFGSADSELTVAATKSTGKKVVHTKTNAWDIPYCRNCLAHIDALRSAHTATVGFIVLSIICAVFLAYSVDPYLGLATGVVGFSGAAFVRKRMVAKARAKCTSQCAAVGEAIRYLGWHGTLHQFDILSAQFASEFMGANERKLVNLSADARNLISSAGRKSPSATRTPRRYIT